VYGSSGQLGGGATISCNVANVAHDGDATMDYMAENSRGIEANYMVQGAEMGLGAGGTMRQQIYPDPHGIDVWDQAASGRIFIHLVNAQMYEEITGEKPPKSPVTAQSYTNAGLPWFDLNDGHMGDVQAPDALVKVKTVGQIDKDKGIQGQQDDSPVNEANVVKYQYLDGYGKTGVRTGQW
jgi:hypothetical protein